MNLPSINETLGAIKTQFGNQKLEYLTLIRP